MDGTRVERQTHDVLIPVVPRDRAGHVNISRLALAVARLPRVVRRIIEMHIVEPHPRISMSRGRDVDHSARAAGRQGGSNEHRFQFMKQQKVRKVVHPDVRFQILLGPTERDRHDAGVVDQDVQLPARATDEILRAAPHALQ